MFTLCEKPPVRKFMQLMLAALLATTTCFTALCHQSRTAHAEEADLGSVGYLSYVGPMIEDTPNKNPSGTVALSNHMEITVGSTVLVSICAEHELDTPPLGTAVRKTGTVTSDDIRRILYYGYRGPEDQGYSVVRTATAVSLANGHMETSLAQDMIDAVRKLPTPPSNWIVEMWNTDASGDQNLVTGRLIRQVGWMELQKKSSNEDITEDSACYSLENAVYGVYATKDDAKNGTNAVAELRTNILGYAKSETLDTGTYFVRETTAPLGMEQDDTVYTVTVMHNSVTRVNADDGGIVYDDPLSTDPSILLQKSDTELLSTPGEPQGEATLAGSVWTAEFYYGYFTSVEEARESGKAMRIWRFVTDEQGIIRLDPAYLAEGSDALWTVDGKPVLPLGTIVWEEEQAPEGYLNTAADHAASTGASYPYLRTITADGGYSAPDAADDVIRGGVRLQKTDAENGTSSPMGGAQLDGATIDIVSNNPHTVRVNGVSYEQGQTVQTLTVSEGWVETDADTLPYGSYIMRESTAGRGYELSTVEREFSIRTDGEIVELSGALSLPNQVKRGDVTLKKTSGAGTVVPNVAFLITSLTTGESHIVVTDENGIASTAASHVPHTSNCNANDQAGEDSYRADAGVWFGLTTEGGITPPNDSLGALPFDSYQLEELVCPANDGLQLAHPLTFSISQSNTTLDLEEIDNPKGMISTSAADGADGDKVIHADAGSTLVDTVTYSNLMPYRTYTLNGYLVNRSTGEPLLENGSRIASSVTFTPEEAHGSVTMSYTFDAYPLGNCEILPFVDLTSENRHLAEHKDLDDTEQIVSVVQPAISTTATAPDGVSKEIACDLEAVVADNVAYMNLIPGKTYTLEGALVHQDTGEAVLDNGIAVTASTSFTPDAAEGSVRMEFALNSLDHRGKSFVVYETLYGDDRALASHKDLSDAAQTVAVPIPLITTLAVDGLDADKTINAHPCSTIRDIVSYENLVPGKEYTAKGYLLYADTAEPLAHEGNRVESTATFVPEQSTGAVEVEFAFDATPFAGRRIVVFESIERMGSVIAEHAVIESEAQTVSVAQPTLDTVAKDTLDGDSLILARADSVIRDSVMYAGLNPDMEYELETSLYDADTKKKLAVDGNKTFLSTLFTPTEPSGAIDIDIAIDASNLEGSTLVVFQTLKADGVVVATHADPLDADQSVGVVLPADPGIFDKTGDKKLAVAVTTLALVAAGIAIAIAIGTRWGERKSKRAVKDRMISKL